VKHRAVGVVIDVDVRDAIAFDIASVLGPCPRVDADADVALVVRTGERAGISGVPVFHHGTVEGYRGPGGGFVLRSAVADVFVIPDEARIEAVVHGVLGDASELRLGVPIFIALAIALRAHGRFHLHAAGLADERGSVLVIGQQGAGKTTTTLALVEAGARFVGDDAVFLAGNDAEPRIVAHGIAKPFHLAARTIAAFPRLRTHCGAVDAHTQKAPLDPARVWPAQMRSALDAPFALVFPEIARDETTALVAMDAAAAFGALLESSALGVVDGMPAVPQQLAVLERVITGARAFRLRLAADALADPARVAALVSARA
jgi:hypothetical protein